MGERKISVGHDWEYDKPVDVSAVFDERQFLEDEQGLLHGPLISVRLSGVPSSEGIMELALRGSCGMLYVNIPSRALGHLTYQYQYALASLRKPSACPHCGSETLSLGDRIYGEETIRQAVSCPKCGAEYHLTYLCIDMTMDEDGREQPEPATVGDVEAQETAATDMDLAADKWLRSRGWQVNEPLGE